MRHRQRDRVLQLVRDHDGAVDAAELAGVLGLHQTTVRFHLDALCDQGAVARTRVRHAGVGRPRTGYVAVQGRLDYRALAEVLALEFGESAPQRRQRAQRAGQRWAQRMLAGPAATGADRVTMTAETFDRMGFTPQLTGRTLALHSCPVRDLARSHPEVACALHLGLLRGLLGTPRAELEPFAGPDLCLATVGRDE